jgi:hypothetical protein
MIRNNKNYCISFLTLSSNTSFPPSSSFSSFTLSTSQHIDTVISQAQVDKAEDIRKEKERRLRGQTLGETQEERDRLARKRENEKIKKEKDVSLNINFCCVFNMLILSVFSLLFFSFLFT